MSRRSGALALLAAVTLVAGLARCVYLDADPPGDVQPHFLTDEGAWAHNARDHALFGRWITDDHNPALWVTPLHTAALAASYALSGVSLASTRRPGALAGVLACTLLAAWLIRTGDPRRALAAGLLLAGSYPALTLSRLAFVESLQLLPLLGAAVGVWAGERRPAAAAAGGLAFGAALLVKPSAVALAPALVGFWAWERLRAGGPARGGPLAAPVAFALGVLPVLAAALVWAAPYADQIEAQLHTSLTMAYANPFGLEGERIAFLGLGRVGLPARGFLLQAAVPVLATALFAAARLGRALATPSDTAERLAWWWLGAGGLFLALQRYQPDRRLLLLAPPLALLLATAWVRDGLRLPGRGDAEGRPGARLAAGAVLGAALGYYAAAAVAWAGNQTGRTALSTPLASAVWSGACLAGAALGLLAWRQLPRGGLRIPAALVLGAFLVLEPLRAAVALARPSYSVRDASRALEALSADWPTGSRVMVGDVADTFALETTLFAFLIRDWDEAGAHMNLDGWARFHPDLALVAAPAGLPFPELGAPRPEAFRVWRDLDVWHGKWRVRVHVRRDRLAPEP